MGVGGETTGTSWLSGSVARNKRREREFGLQEFDARRSGVAEVRSDMWLSGSEHHTQRSWDVAARPSRSSRGFVLGVVL